MINTRENPGWSIAIMEMIDQWIADNGNFSDCIKAYDGCFSHEFGTERVTDHELIQPDSLEIELDYNLPCYCKASGETFKTIDALAVSIIELKNEYQFDDLEMKFSFENRTSFNENLEVEKLVMAITVEIAMK